MQPAETEQQTAERQLTWIEQRLAAGKYTCTIREFASLYSIGYDKARELCKSRNPPPGVRSGSHYRILLEDLPCYMLELSKRQASSGS